MFTSFFKAALISVDILPPIPEYESCLSPTTTTLTLANNFVSSNKEEQDLEHFLNHLDAAVEIMSVDNVCFGFDFMDYLVEFPNSNIQDVSDATLAYRIIEGMRKRGYSEEDIQKICYDNFYSRFQDCIFNK